MSNTPWTRQQTAEWFGQQPVIRDLRGVKNRIKNAVDSSKTLSSDAYQTDGYGNPFLVVTNSEEGITKPSLLLTGSVHGCDESSVTACLQVIEDMANGAYSDIDITVMPVVNPLSYVIGHRWGFNAADMDQQFNQSATSQEAHAFFGYVLSRDKKIDVSLNLQEVQYPNPEFQRLVTQRTGIEPAPILRPTGSFLVSSAGKQNDAQDIEASSMILERASNNQPIKKHCQLTAAPNYEGVVYDPVRMTLTGFMTDHADHAFTAKVLTKETTADGKPQPLLPLDAAARQQSFVNGAVDFLRQTPF